MNQSLKNDTLKHKPLKITMNRYKTVTLLNMEWSFIDGDSGLNRMFLNNEHQICCHYDEQKYNSVKEIFQPYVDITIWQLPNW